MKKLLILPLFFTLALAGCGEDPAPTLSSIRAIDPVSEYVVGDEFVKPSVIATYSDQSTKEVKDEATFSGYNMAEAGEYTVLVNYETKETSFHISVKNPLPDFEVPEGHIGFFMVLTNESLKVPDYVSIYVTGDFAKKPSETELPSTRDRIMLLEKFEDTEYYFGTFERNPDDLESYHYEVHLGFSEGLLWHYYSKESKLENNLTPEFEEVKEGLYTLGTHTFEEIPNEEATVSYTFIVRTTEAVPSYGALFITGDFNNWNPSAKLEATSSERNEFKLDVTGPNNKIEVSVYEGYNDASSLTWDDDFKLLNKVVTVNDVSEPIDLGKVIYDLEEPQPLKNVTLKATMSEALPDYAALFISGDFNSWSTGAKMSANNDRTEFTFTLDSINIGKYKFQIVCDYASKTTMDWNYKIYSNDGEGVEISFKLEDSDNVKVVAEDLVFDASKLPDPDAGDENTVDISFTLILEAQLDTSVNPDWYVSGSFLSSSWTDVKMTYKEEGTNRTLTASTKVNKNWNLYFAFYTASWHIDIKENGNNFHYKVNEDAVEVALYVNPDGVAMMNTPASEGWVHIPAYWPVD